MRSTVRPNVKLILAAICVIAGVVILWRSFARPPESVANVALPTLTEAVEPSATLPISSQPTPTASADTGLPGSPTQLAPTTISAPTQLIPTQLAAPTDAANTTVITPTVIATPVNETPLGAPTPVIATPLQPTLQATSTSGIGTVVATSTPLVATSVPQATSTPLVATNTPQTTSTPQATSVPTDLPTATPTGTTVTDTPTSTATQTATPTLTPTSTSNAVVVYRVEGAASKVVVSYLDETGKENTVEVTLPWRIQFNTALDADLAVDAFSVYNEVVPLTCAIEINGTTLLTDRTENAVNGVACERFIN